MVQKEFAEVALIGIDIFHSAYLAFKGTSVVDTSQSLGTCQISTTRIPMNLLNSLTIKKNDIHLCLSICSLPTFLLTLRGSHAQYECSLLQVENDDSHKSEGFADNRGNKKSAFELHYTA